MKYYLITALVLSLSLQATGTVPSLTPKNNDSSLVFPLRFGSKPPLRLTDYLPLTGGVLGGELQLNYSGARIIYQSGSDLMGMGMWDAVNARIESNNRPLYFTTYSGDISMGISGAKTMTVTGTSVGIGTTSPGDILEVRKDQNATTNFYFRNADSTNAGSRSYIDLVSGNTSLVLRSLSGADQYIAFTPGHNLYFQQAANTPEFTIADGGNIGIGTINPTAKLEVNGTIRTKKIQITQTGWSDYVFAKQYKLMSLSSLASFIKQNKQLPEMPSAKEVEEKGISVGDNQALLLKKIEELTLYVIDLQKQVNRQKKQILLAKKK